MLSLRAARIINKGTSNQHATHYLHGVVDISFETPVDFIKVATESLGADPLNRDGEIFVEILGSFNEVTLMYDSKELVGEYRFALIRRSNNADGISYTMDGFVTVAAMSFYTAQDMARTTLMIKRGVPMGSALYYSQRIKTGKEKKGVYTYVVSSEQAV